MQSLLTTAGTDPNIIVIGGQKLDFSLKHGNHGFSTLLEHLISILYTYCITLLHVCKEFFVQYFFGTGH